MRYFMLLVVLSSFAAPLSAFAQQTQRPGGPIPVAPAPPPAPVPTIASLAASGFRAFAVQPSSGNAGITLMYLQKNADIYMCAFVPLISAVDVEMMSLRAGGIRTGCTKL